MRIKGKVFRVGNSYGIRLSKLWVDSGIIREGEELDVELPIELREKDGQAGICTYLNNHLFSGKTGESTV